MKGRARFLITPDLLRNLFPLPESTVIIGSRPNGSYVEVVVEDPAFPKVADGVDLPLVTPLFQRQPRVVFVGWGKP